MTMHDDQFTATGPSLTGSGFPRSGFSTKASDMVYGVNVQGEFCGVYGESALSAVSDREADINGTGVFGQGERVGLFGHCRRGIAGVFGRHRMSSGVGTIGVAIDGTGVVGASHSSIDVTHFEPPVDPARGNGIGVFGTSGDGAGVRGSSNAGDGGQFESNSGVGVRGSSTEDRGGVFTSGTPGGRPVPQTRLVPFQQREPFPILPQNGKVGDLLMIRNTAPGQRGELIDRTSLWLCIPSDPNSEDSDQWQQVSLGATVTGTL